MLTLFSEDRMLELIVALYCRAPRLMYLNDMSKLKVLIAWLQDSPAYLPNRTKHEWPAVADVPNVCRSCGRKLASSGGHLLTGCDDCKSLCGRQFIDMYAVQRISMLTGFHQRAVEAQFCKEVGK